MRTLSGPTLTSPLSLSAHLRAFAVDQLTGLFERYAPDGRLDGVFGGFSSGTRECAGAVDLLTGLRRMGVERILDESMEARIRQQLAHIDGATAKTFSCFRIGEAIAEGGVFSPDNPLLQGFTPNQLEHLRRACDATTIYDREKRELISHPENYWAVLARSESARLRLGLTTDRSIFEQSIEKIQTCFSRHVSSFWDDDVKGRGRYDIYSFDVLLFLEPLWENIGLDVIHERLRRHLQLFEKMALENGASVAWGRSTGLLSVAMTLELTACGLVEGLSQDPERLLGLAINASNQLDDWFEDNLVSAHRGRHPYYYRGADRRLDMTFDSLRKIVYAAEAFRKAGAGPNAATSNLFPPVNHWQAFEPARPIGVRMVRESGLCFQLPVVGGALKADYDAFPHWPKVWDAPVDSDLPVWLPRFWIKQEAFVPDGAPCAVNQRREGLQLSYLNVRKQGSEEIRPGAVKIDCSWAAGELVWAVSCSGLEVDQVSLMIPESERPLRVWQDEEAACVQRTVPVSGMQVFRSFWGEMRHLHEFQWRSPSANWQTRLRVRPLIRVLVIPGDHDYLQTVYGAMEADWLAVTPIPQGLPFTREGRQRLLDLADRHEVVHIGWPENLFSGVDAPGEDLLAGWRELLSGFDQRSCRLVWTLHNRGPHRETHREAFLEIYAMLAKRVDAALHHSVWGMKVMRDLYPFAETCCHVLVPHPHYEQFMQVSESREHIEKDLGLPACRGIRFAVHGRPQSNKRVDMIMRAFAASRNPTNQLLVTAWDDSPLPIDDARIVVRPRKGWLQRAQIARYHAVSDVLISGHTGENYLTSGLVADAAGCGMPMIVPEWAFFEEVLGDAALYYDGSEAELTACLDSLKPEDYAKAVAAIHKVQMKSAPKACAATLLKTLQAMAGFERGPNGPRTSAPK